MSSISENVDDRLSALPEEIHSHILSLMPTKFAVQTSILSKRWRYTWMFVTNLDFDDIYHIHGLDTLSNFVDRVLESRKTSQLQLFRLHLSKIRAPKSHVSSWIDKAVMLNVRELDIHVIRLALPLNLLTCKTLTKLSLGISGANHEVWDSRSPVNLPCLKTLDVVLWKAPFHNAFKLINGCPVIESLSLEVKDCSGEKELRFNIPTLRRLKLTFAYAYAAISVVLNVPRLKYLFVGGALYSSFVVEDLSSLIEAFVSVRETMFSYLLADLLERISGVRSISLQYFVRCQPLPIFPNVKCLELKDIWEPILIPKLLDCCPRLEHLCIKKPKVCPWCDWKWVPTCVRTSLTTLKIKNCDGRMYDMELLKYMLGNAEVLKTITITWGNVCIEEQTRLATQVLNFPRASMCCEIHFVGS